MAQTADHCPTNVTPYRLDYPLLRKHCFVLILVSVTSRWAIFFRSGQKPKPSQAGHHLAVIMTKLVWFCAALLMLAWSRQGCHGLGKVFMKVHDLRRDSEDDVPWNFLQDYSMIMERLPCFMNYRIQAINFFSTMPSLSSFQSPGTHISFAIIFWFISIGQDVVKFENDSLQLFLTNKINYS